MVRGVKITSLVLATFLAGSVLLSGCGSKFSPQNHPQNTAQSSPSPSVGESTKQEGTTAASPTPQPTEAPVQPQIDVNQVKPNEAGKIMVVMFHNFVEAYKSGDKQYTTTFDDFRKLLPVLYDKGYRLISLNDLINNNIQVPAGFIPLVFTFDDGTAGQFNLVEENGQLVANRQSAVGIMEEFNKQHPDFGLRGTFYVNLGSPTFPGAGELKERLQYLIDKGFDIGNHTYTHVNLKKVKTAEEIQKAIGENQKKMVEIIPGYTMMTLSLPYGLPSKELQTYVANGEFEGVKYENKGILEVGWDPTYSPVNAKFNPLSIHRVRASGIVPVEADLAWWLEQLSRGEQYVSDGNPDTITVPKAREANVDAALLNGKKLVIY